MNLPNLFILSFAFLSVACAVGGESSVVLDWNGDPVEAGVSYDIWSVGQNRGPIALGSSIVGTKCSFNVISRPNRWPNPFLPTPIKFFGANNSESFVRVGQDYNFIFDRDAERPCNVWKVNLALGSGNHNFITTGGQSGHPGCWNVDTWFQLQLTDDAQHLYKIIANPQVCHEGSHCQEDIVLVADNDEDRLYLNQRQFLDMPHIDVRFNRHTSSILEASE